MFWPSSPLVFLLIKWFARRFLACNVYITKSRLYLFWKSCWFFLIQFVEFFDDILLLYPRRNLMSNCHHHYYSLREAVKKEKMSKGRLH